MCGCPDAGRINVSTGRHGLFQAVLSGIAKSIMRYAWD
jgi:hypothetical protein